MIRWTPELIALPMLPLLIAQGRRTRRLTPRLPEADGPCSGLVQYEGSGQPALSLIAIGESPVAGVGVATHEQAITAALARSLSLRMNRPVAWQACGRNGITAREALTETVPRLPEQAVDIALVAFGVNDSTAFRSTTQWRSDMQALLDAIQARCRPGLFLLSGVPPLARFPALPQPLRWVIGLKAAELDRALQAVAPQRQRCRYVPVAIDAMDRTLMAEDGYHPSESGCKVWADMLAETASGVLVTR